LQSPSVTGLPSRPEKLTFLTRFLATRDTIDAARLKPSYYRATFLVLLLFYLALTAAQASRHLWYDELFTYYIAKSPSLASMWQNIRLDLTPPLVFLAERFALKTFGDNLYAARLPSILGFAVGSFCFGKFVSPMQWNMLAGFSTMPLQLASTLCPFLWPNSSAAFRQPQGASRHGPGPPRRAKFSSRQIVTKYGPI